MSTELTKKEEKAVEFVPFGASEAIRLTAAMVANFIAVPTRSGKLPSERDCMRFIMLCRGKRANPFEGDCFLIGYDSAAGPSFSLVCGIELFLKRAEQSNDYDGRESGIIVERDGDIKEREGTMTLEGEKLVGGWAKVYRKGRSRPEYKSVRFATYNTGRSRWEKDPAGQIEKVALSQALRTAYPTALGALYVQQEMERITEVGATTMTGREPIPMPKALGEGATNIQTEALPPIPEQTSHEKIIIALADLDFSEERFVKGINLLKRHNIPKSAKVIADLRDDVADQIWTEGLDDLLAEIEAKEAPANA